MSDAEQRPLGSTGDQRQKEAPLVCVDPVVKFTN